MPNVCTEVSLIRDRGSRVQIIKPNAPGPFECELFCHADS